MLAAVGCSSESLYFAKCQGGQAGGAGGAASGAAGAVATTESGAGAREAAAGEAAAGEAEVGVGEAEAGPGEVARSSSHSSATTRASSEDDWLFPRCSTSTHSTPAALRKRGGQPAAGGRCPSARERRAAEACEERRPE